MSDQLTPSVSADADDAILNADIESAIRDAERSDDSEDTVVVSSHASLTLKRDGVETNITFVVPPKATIGRFDPSVGPIDIDLGPLPEGVYISRKHARISQTESGWVITDLGSSNGTFILREDYERVEEAELENGSELALGNARFVFRF